MDDLRAPDDLTARARIRDAAFVLIAQEGVRGTTLRGIARGAGVSAALVNHHYGSKQGVVDAVAQWVLELLRSATEHEPPSDDPAEASANRAVGFQRLLDSVPMIGAYIRRMLLDDTPEGLDWFAHMVEYTAGELRRREEAGMARPSGDICAEAAILNILALGPILLPRHLEHVLGTGGNDAEILGRWREASGELLRSALYPPAREH
jgi:AcrR family transcriptional regulator